MVGELRARQIRFLHQLFGEIARYCEDEHGMSSERLTSYRENTVTPTDFKATKPQHERALLEIADAVSEWAREELSEPPETKEPSPVPSAR